MSADSHPPADDAESTTADAAKEPTIDPYTGEVIGIPTQAAVMRYCVTPYWAGCFQADHIEMDLDGVDKVPLSLIEFRTLVGGAMPMRIIFAMSRKQAAELGRYLVWLDEPDDAPAPSSGFGKPIVARERDVDDEGGA